MTMTAEGIGIIVFCVLMVGIGFFFSKKVQGSSSDFFLGGRNTALPLLVAGHVMGWVGSGTLVGMYGSAYHGGLAAAFWYPFGFTVAFFVFAFVFAKRVKRLGDKRRVFTFVEIIRRRLSARVAAVYSVLQIAQDLAIFVGQIVAIALILNMSMGISPLIGSTIAAIVVLVYVSMGGLSGSLTNTLIQMLLTLLGLLIAVVIGLRSTGGLAGLMASLPEGWDPNPFSGLTVSSFFAGFLPTLLASFVYSTMYTRTFAAKDQKTAVRACVWAGVVAAGVLVLSVLGVFVTVSQVPGLENGDYALFELFRKVLPVGGGLFAAAVLAACMSTASEALLDPAAIVSKDLYLGMFKPDATEKQVLRVSKITMVVYCAASVFVAVRVQSILDLMYYAINILACVVPVFMLAFFWNRINNQGAAAGFAVGGVVAIVWDYIPGVSGVLPTLYAGIILASAVTVIVSFMFPAPTEKQLEFILPYQTEDCGDEIIPEHHEKTADHT